MSRALDLADAVVALLKPTFGNVQASTDPWDDTIKTPRPTLFVFVDPNGEKREKVSKGHGKETLAIIVAISCVLESEWTFRKLMKLAEDVVDYELPNEAITCGPITWKHDGPNQFRTRYVQGLIKEEAGVLDGTFVSFVEMPFRRSY